jgi:hypothetical protein
MNCNSESRPMSVQESVLIADPTNALGIPRWSGAQLTARHKEPAPLAPCDTLATPPRVAPIADELPLAVSIC